VLSGYRITIPKEIREKFNIKVGDELEIVEESLERETCIH